jgi:hypothetical protein
LGIGRKFLVRKPLAPYSAFVLAVALLFAAAATALAPYVYPSVAGDYAVNFPSTPKEDVQTSSAYRIVSHAISEDSVIYIVAHGDFQVPPPPEIELDANIDNYVKELHANVFSRGPLAIGRGDKPLLAKQFTYESDRMTGKGIVVVDGKSSYLAAASALKPASREAAVNAFLSSFRLVPPN